MRRSDQGRRRPDHGTALHRRPQHAGRRPQCGKKVKGTLHWVSATQCLEAEVRLYDRLFTIAEPGADENFGKFINPHSLEIVSARLEASLADAAPGQRFQFERLGYFIVDAKDSAPGKPVFNRTISLKDTWAKK